MYEHLAGTLERLSGEVAVVDVAGIGYRLRIPLSTARALRVDRPVKLFVTHRIAPEALQLFGFATREERQAFEKICGVTGVGPAVALAILSALTLEQFREIVLRGETKALEKIRGVGKKTSQRLILELRGALEEADLRGEPEPAEGPAADAVKALVALGFTPSEAEARVRRAVTASPDSAVADLVRRASRG